MRSDPTGLAFYDFDGTLVAGNVVERYARLLAWLPSRAEAARRGALLALSIPILLNLERASRRRFNLAFYRAYRGLREDWLRAIGERMFEEIIRPSIYPEARAMIEEDRAAGYAPVLLTGELDVVLGPTARRLGFDAVVCNVLVFKRGVATGRVRPPLIAEAEKAAAIRRVCRERGVPPSRARAYSDSLSDVPMLAAVGQPTAVNPDRRLRAVAARHGWPIRNLSRGKPC